MVSQWQLLENQRESRSWSVEVRGLTSFYFCVQDLRGGICSLEVVYAHLSCAEKEGEGRRERKGGRGEKT